MVEGAKMKYDWKKDMDALVEHAQKNWYRTGKVKKAKGLTAQVSLVKKETRSSK